jgi:hypothetical protein
LEEYAKKETKPACCLLHAGFLLGLNFEVVDDNVMFLRNVGYIHQSTRRYIAEEESL